MKNRPNMQIRVHYVDQPKEYATANNCNVLINEDKHCEYKELVRQTNKRDVEKILLIQESFKCTISLILDRALIDTEPHISAQMKQIYCKCPSLIKDLVFLELNNQLEDDENEHMDLDAAPQYAGTNTQSATNAFGRLTVCNNINVLGIPNMQLSELPIAHPLLQRLWASYEQDWKMNCFIGRGTASIQLFDKVSFAFNGDAYRTSMRWGNLLEYISPSGLKCTQILSIFNHRLGQKLRIFFVVLTTRQIKYDQILNLPILQVEKNHNYEIIGLSTIRDPNLYTLPIGNDCEHVRPPLSV